MQTPPQPQPPDCSVPSSPVLQCSTCLVFGAEPICQDGKPSFSSNKDLQVENVSHSNPGLDAGPLGNLRLELPSNPLWVFIFIFYFRTMLQGFRVSRLGDIVKPDQTAGPSPKERDAQHSVPHKRAIEDKCSHTLASTHTLLPEKAFHHLKLTRLASIHRLYYKSRGMRLKFLKAQLQKIPCLR